MIEDCGIVGAEEEKPEEAPGEEQLPAEEPKGATMSTAEWLAQAGGEGWCYTPATSPSVGQVHIYLQCSAMYTSDQNAPIHCPQIGYVQL